VNIREEQHIDGSAVRAVHLAAFIKTSAEANLIDTSRLEADSIVSFIAEEEHYVFEHIIFSPMTLGAHEYLTLMDLAPVTALPERQSTGTALINAGLKRCKILGVGAIFVLGYPDYYGKFGFQPSACFRITSEYNVPVEAFMALEPPPDYLNGAPGTIKFHIALQTI